MSRVTASYDFDKVPKEEQVRYLTIWAEQVTRLVNGSLNFSDNTTAVFKPVTFTSSGQTVAVQTGVNSVRNNYIVVNNSTNAVIYNGNQQNQVGVLYVQADQATTATLMIF